jgi:hypothetical protein
MPSLKDLFSELDAAAPPDRLERRILHLQGNAAPEAHREAPRRGRERTRRAGRWLAVAVGAAAVAGLLVIAAHTRQPSEPRPLGTQPRHVLYFDNTPAPAAVAEDIARGVDKFNSFLSSSREPPLRLGTAHQIARFHDGGRVAHWYVAYDQAGGGSCDAVVVGSDTVGGSCQTTPKSYAWKVATTSAIGNLVLVTGLLPEQDKSAQITLSRSGTPRVIATQLQSHVPGVPASAGLDHRIFALVMAASPRKSGTPGIQFVGKQGSIASHWTVNSGCFRPDRAPTGASAGTPTYHVCSTGGSTGNVVGSHRHAAR